MVASSSLSFGVTGYLLIRENVNTNSSLGNKTRNLENYIKKKPHISLLGPIGDTLANGIVTKLHGGCKKRRVAYGNVSHPGPPFNSEPYV